MTWNLEATGLGGRPRSVRLGRDGEPRAMRWRADRRRPSVRVQLDRASMTSARQCEGSASSPCALSQTSDARVTRTSALAPLDNNPRGQKE